MELKEMLRELQKGELADEMFGDLLLRIYEEITLIEQLPLDRVDGDKTFFRAYWQLKKAKDLYEKEVNDYINTRWNK